jgi:hypothetical protein
MNRREKLKDANERLLAMADLADLLARHGLVINHDLETVRIEEPEGGNSLLIEDRAIDSVQVIRWATNEIRNSAKKVK